MRVKLHQNNTCKFRGLLWLETTHVSSLAPLLSVYGVAYNLYADDPHHNIFIENVCEAENTVESLYLDTEVRIARRKLKLNDGKTEFIIVMVFDLGCGQCTSSASKVSQKFWCLFEFIIKILDKPTFVAFVHSGPA